MVEEHEVASNPGDDDAPTGPLDVHESFLHEEHPLHRPRHGRHVGSGVAAVAFLLVPALAFVLGVRPAAFENRALAAFPSVSQGWGFLGGLPLWASDHLPLRQQAVQAADGISQGVFSEPFPFGAQQAPGILGPVAPVAGRATGPSGVAVQDDDTRRMGAAGFPVVVPGRSDWLFYGYDEFAACEPVRDLSSVVAGLVDLRAAVERSGRKFVLVVAPDKSSAVTDQLPATFVGQDCAEPAWAEFWDRVVREAGAVDLRPDLAKVAQTSGEPAYFHQDTHWTFDGGLLMTRSIAEQITPGVTSTWTTPEREAWTGPADLPPLTGLAAQSSTELQLLAPGGRDVVRPDGLADLHDPVELSAPGGPGTVSDRVTMLGDSFSQFASPYLGAVFRHLWLGHVDLSVEAEQEVVDHAVDSDVVVVEVAQRYLQSGESLVLDPGWISELGDALGASPPP